MTTLMLASLDTCGDLIYSRACVNFKQTTVDSFFTFEGLALLFVVNVCDVILEVRLFGSAALLAQNAFEPKRANKAESAVLVSKANEILFPPGL